MSKAEGAFDEALCLMSFVNIFTLPPLFAQLSLPLGVSIRLLEHVVLSPHVHDAIFEIEFPFVSRPGDL